MEKFVHATLIDDTGEILNARIQMGLKLLWEASQTAQTVNRDSWEFAVEIGQLYAVGLTNSDLRWLLCQGYAQHATEQIQDGRAARTFQQLANLALPPGTCFVLTSKGFEAIAGLSEPEVPTSAVPLPESAKPHWDPVLRRLIWKGQLVKEFRIPAENQEAILDRFEIEGWPPRIEDPLEKMDGVDRKARLHDAIKGLNRNQVNPLLLFRGDGTTRGILWSLIQEG